MRDHAIFGPGFHLGVHTLNGAWMATQLGCKPTHDLVFGLATVWPDFDPATEQR